jgi:hypothetical protein
MIHKSVEIEALCLWEKRRIVFPVMIWGSMTLWQVSLYAHFNKQPCDELGGGMILWEVGFEYAWFNEQPYIKNKKVYEQN